MSETPIIILSVKEIPLNFKRHFILNRHDNRYYKFPLKSHLKAKRPHDSDRDGERVGGGGGQREGRVVRVREREISADGNHSLEGGRAT